MGRCCCEGECCGFCWWLLLFFVVYFSFMLLLFLLVAAIFLAAKRPQFSGLSEINPRSLSTGASSFHMYEMKEDCQTKLLALSQER